jgi:WD40 repeat protein
MDTIKTNWSVSPQMIAANANTVFNAVSYNDELQLIAYAASNTVLVLDPTTTCESNGRHLSMPRVLFALNAHTSRVNSVQWLNQTTLVSIGGDEHLIVVWRCDLDKARNPASWRVHQQIPGETSGHKNTLTYLCAYHVSDQE